jgi:ribosomal protein S18 acetylase RimI-like enzyme
VARIFRPLRRSETEIDVRLLTPEDVDRVRLPWDARHSAAELREFATSPRSVTVWNSKTGEYLVGGPWRHRDDVSTVVDIIGARSAHELLLAFLDRCSQLDQAMALVSEYAERRKPSFYDAVGFDLLEEIVVYELDISRRTPKRYPEITMRPVDWHSPEDREALLRLDHQAFPWLWRNSEDEFQNYVEAPGVVILAGFEESGQAFAYAGTTTLRNWGHLDRIAVAPSAQGRGLGGAVLDFAVRFMAQGGARRIALSTQSANTVSRRLYESYGFRRTPSHDYRLYGRWLSDSLVP